MLTIHNQSRIRVRYLKPLKQSIIQGLTFLNVDSFDINVIIASEKLISSLNEKYLKHSGATDVIAFSLNPSLKDLQGEIYLGARHIRGNARYYNTEFIWELCFSAVHGILHLSGYNDANKKDREIMFAIQYEVLKKLPIFSSGRVC